MGTIMALLSLFPWKPTSIYVSLTAFGNAGFLLYCDLLKPTKDNQVSIFVFILLAYSSICGVSSRPMYDR